MGITDIEDDETIWQLCWDVNSYFAVKIDKTQRCLKCGVALRNTTYRSNLVAIATTSDCQHPTTGLLCGICDHDFLFHVLQGQQTCFQDECEENIQISLDSIKTKVSQLLFEKHVV
jgi:hypothetical protein